MHIVTIMDYTDPLGVSMCKIWLYLAYRFNPTARISVFHAGPIPEIAAFSARFPCVGLLPLDTSGILDYRATRGFGVRSQEFILSLWRHQDQGMDLGQYLYIEADAFILGPLDKFWAIVPRMPYVGVQELIRPDGKPLINTGVYGYTSSSRFVTYAKLMRQYEADGCEIKIPVGEQGILNSYFRSIDYDCRHPDIGFEYNCWTVNCVVERADDEAIVVFSGDFPTGRVFADHPWSWWGYRRRVSILHGFMAKFWHMPECKQLWDYCLGKVNSM